MAKTGGSSLNGELALNYERICGLKGYSYDYFQAQERYKHNPVGIENHGYRRRLVVAPETMDEIGYEDCDFVSQEDHWYWWRQFASWKVRVELHFPCRDPIDHLLSNCNYANVTFNCEGDLVNEISRCLLYMDRFSNSLNGSRDFPNFNVKCFRSELTSKYIEYMGTRLQRKRFQSTYAFRPTNKARNKRYECLWQNESAKLQVENYLKELDYYKFCNKCIDSPDDLLAYWNQELLHSRSSSPGAQEHEAATFERLGQDLVLYGHIHMAKTGGSSLNGELALNYERICGSKGYSYDYFQAQERYRQNPAYVEQIGFNRLVVAPETMDEIGYEDCDFVSQEDHWYWWRQFASWKVRVELHLPCRDPIDHLLSNCNYANVTFNCEGDLVNEISRCLLYMDRFSNSLNGSRDFPNFNVKCFRSELTSKYIEYMGTRLQRKRFQSTYAFRPTNKARNKRYECLWQNESAKLQVENYLKELDYYKFCNKCIDSPDDLLADDVSLEGGDYSE